MLFVQIADLTLVISVISLSDRTNLTLAIFVTGSDHRSEVSTVHTEIDEITDLKGLVRC